MTVTISGFNLSTATQVMFGSTAAASFTVVSSTQITAVTPAELPGTVNVIVTTPAGTTPVVAADQFTFVLNSPEVTSVSPNSGSTSGGTLVTITGVNLMNVSSVVFGTAQAQFHRQFADADHRHVAGF